MVAPNRTSGILLHPTSLPGPNGIGELGPAAFRFADWLFDAGQTLWQVLPLGPTGYGESPYQLFSAFAGNPLLIGLDPLTRTPFPRIVSISSACFPASRRSSTMPSSASLPLPSSTLSPCRKPPGSNRTPDSWPSRTSTAASPGRNGIPQAQADPRQLEYHRFLQFEFFRQWNDLRRYCAERGIRIMGDIPIYVAHDSADVWANPELFQLDSAGRPTAVAGVPPDYFSATGQLWGNPVYHWDRIAAGGYRWWIERMRAALRMFDLVRMDHFRGFEAYWEVPASESTAVNGRWVKGPGAALFRALESAIGPLPIVAENLGVITPEVEAIRQEFHFPGMAILQFAFGKDPQAPTFQPHNYPRDVVAYTGTHDNDTVIGWWNSHGGDSTRTEEDVRREKARAQAYLNTDGSEMNWTLIRTLMASVADTVIFPAQDVLGLGSEARMNTPAVPDGNWRWRLREGLLTPSMAARLREMAQLYGRGLTSATRPVHTSIG